MPGGVFSDPSATIYFANGAVYDGGFGFRGGLITQNESEGQEFRFSDGSVSFNLVPLVRFYSGDPSNEANLFGQFNPATGVFKSAYGSFETVDESLIAQYGNFSLQVQLGAALTVRSFRNNAIILGAGMLFGPAPEEAAFGAAAAGGGGGGARIALGLGDRLEEFAASKGATTWKDFADPLNWKAEMTQQLSDPAVTKLFNLDGVDVWKGVSRAAAGGGGATDWELFQIYSNPEWQSSVQWFKNGEQVVSPFAK